MTGGGEGGGGICPSTWRGGGSRGPLPESFKKECNLVQSGAFAVSDPAGCRGVHTPPALQTPKACRTRHRR